MSVGGAAAGCDATIGGVAMRLLAERALLLPDCATLLVADVHLGKAETFSALGVPVPDAVTDATLDRLEACLAATGAGRLVVLGDWLHGPQAQHPRVLRRLATWRERHPRLAVVLVDGNHDRRAGPLPPALDFERVAEPFDPPFCDRLRFVHDLQAAGDEAGDRYRLAGHLHPCLRLHGPGGDALRLPCFWFGEASGVLPAFGDFTGGASIRRRPADRVFVAGGAVVREVGTAPRGPGRQWHRMR